MEAKAKSVQQQLRSGRSMEDVAQGDSQVRLQTRQQVNVNGVTYLGHEFAGTLYGLSQGQTSGVVKTERALYIIRCDSRQTPPMTQPSPFTLQNRLNGLQQKVREWAEKRPRVIDYRNPFNL
jgi:parvulin-like peptidyl-prolyl isomerase